MGHHEWGDDWFKKYGNTLYEAEAEIYNRIYNETYLIPDLKEKYGTLRYGTLFIIKPRWLHKLMHKAIRIFWPIKGVFSYSKRIYIIPRFIYTKLMSVQIKKVCEIIKETAIEYPEIQEEILSDARMTFNYDFDLTSE